MKMVDKMDVNKGMYSTFIEENSIFMEKFFTFMEDHKKSFVRMFFAFGLQMDIIWVARGTRLEILISRPKRQSYVDFGDKSQIPGGGEESPNMWPIIKMKIEDIPFFRDTL